MSDSNAGKTEKLAKVVGRMSFELKTETFDTYGLKREKSYVISSTSRFGFITDIMLMLLTKLYWVCHNLAVKPLHLD
ncbi:MAG: hypothetical protein IAX21_00185 [Candidatus Bathyarchaeota archaeon]|nr:MAG: hypothetical protein IAX21_00185 [Candidatus Bathyarchaeota archaeon]